MTIGGLPSICAANPVEALAHLVVFNASTRYPNASYGVNNTFVKQDGCSFQFSDNVTETPKFIRITPARGHYPALATITGAGFAPRGNVVTLGLRRAEVVSENASHIVVAVPKHVGGTYNLSVVVPHRGLAVGSRQWYRFESGIHRVSPSVGSRYAGQRITVTGFGFAPAGPANRAPSKAHRTATLSAEAAADEAAEAEAYAALFGAWRNYGTANESAPFDLDVVAASFDTLVATTQLRGARALEGDNSGPLHALAVDVALPGAGFIGPASYKFVASSNNGKNVGRAFDGDATTVFDAYVFALFTPSARNAPSLST